MGYSPRVAKSQTWLSTQACMLEKAAHTHAQTHKERTCAAGSSQFLSTVTAKVIGGCCSMRMSRVDLKEEEQDRSHWCAYLHAGESTGERAWTDTVSKTPSHWQATCLILPYFYTTSTITGASLVVQMVKNLPGMRETWVPSLDWEDPLEEDTATHSSILVWRIPMDRGAWQDTVHGVEKNWTWLSD